tara:strand:+ start:5149 stop:5562 length:414 start_codon:yes stop_codon:yes gene_type:complete
MTSTNRERLKTLYKKYLLTKDDIYSLKFGNKKIPIITRTGIDKIQAIEKIKINFDCIEYTPGVSAAAKATATFKDLLIESFGEANNKNNKNSYPLAMAEKRAMSRVILKLTGFYELGVYGEDEIEEPEEPSKPWQNT